MGITCPYYFARNDGGLGDLPGKVVTGQATRLALSNEVEKINGRTEVTKGRWHFSGKSYEQGYESFHFVFL